MPVWKPHERHFRDAVESLLRQTMTDWELVIVEDPSPIQVAPWLADYGDPRIRLVTNSERTSLVDQRNRTLSEARGEFVAVLDADDVCEPIRLEAQLQAFDRQPDVDVLGSQTIIINGDGLIIGRRQYPCEHAAIVAAMRRFNPLAHSTVMARRAKFLDAGGYQYRRYAGCEDYELWMRMARYGCRFANLDGALVRYRVQPLQLKAQQLRDQLRGTLELKRTYWDNSLDWRARMRLAVECGLLWLPPAMVMWLFRMTQYRRHLRPADKSSLSKISASG